MRYLGLLFAFFSFLLSQIPQSPHQQISRAFADANQSKVSQSKVELTSVRYEVQKEDVKIILSFSAPIGLHQISKSSKNYFKIDAIAPIKPRKKQLSTLVENIFIFSEKNSLFIAPDSKNPISAQASLSQDGKTLTLSLLPLFHSQPAFSPIQYLSVLALLVILILALYFIKYSLRRHGDKKLQTQKYFIDAKSFLLELRIEDSRYFILSTPRGQVLLDSQKSTFNDILSQKSSLCPLESSLDDDIQPDPHASSLAESEELEKLKQLVTDISNHEQSTRKKTSDKRSKKSKTRRNNKKTKN